MAELAVIGTVGSIAASGAKLAVLLYNFSTTVAGAKKEVASVAESISVFCTVLKLLGSTLEKQESARFSVSALSTVYEILGYCRKQFDEILNVVNKLQKERDGGYDGENREGGIQRVEMEVDVLARVKWVFKRGEVKRMQRDLDSMKLTLGIMLQALEFKKISVEQRYSAAQRATELEETQCVAESLIMAQNANEEEMALLEEESDNLQPLSSAATEQSWRGSTYLGGPIDPGTRPDPRKQFHNLVHVWAETGGSSTSGPNGRAVQRTKESLALARALATKDAEPTYARKEHSNLGQPDKLDQTARAEPKADAIRGTAAIVRRFPQVRQKAESAEARRLDEGKQIYLEPVENNEQYEWGGIRRRETTLGTSNLGLRRLLGMVDVLESDDGGDTFYRMPTPGEPNANISDISKHTWATETEEERLGLVRGSNYERRGNGKK